MLVMFQTAELYSISPWALAVKRVPALILTMALELIGGVVIDQLHRVTNMLACFLTMSRLLSICVNCGLSIRM